MHKKRDGMIFYLVTSRLLGASRSLGTVEYPLVYILFYTIIQIIFTIFLSQQFYG